MFVLGYIVLIYIIGAIIGYLLGSIPFALIIGKGLKGIDVREHGSGNLGGTNVGRVLGAKWGIIVIICDMLKGFFATLIGFYIGGEGVALVAGLFAVIGHGYPVFAKFKGGKGVATGAGIFLFLAPIPVTIALLAFGICLILFRYVSLASIVAAAAGIVVLVIPEWLSGIHVNLIVRFAGIAVALFIIIKHRSNIRKLLNGEEKKITHKENNK